MCIITTFFKKINVQKHIFLLINFVPFSKNKKGDTIEKIIRVFYSFCVRFGTVRSCGSAFSGTHPLDDVSFGRICFFCAVQT